MGKIKIFLSNMLKLATSKWFMRPLFYIWTVVVFISHSYLLYGGLSKKDPFFLVIVWMLFSALTAIILYFIYRVFILFRSGIKLGFFKLISLIILFALLMSVYIHKDMFWSKDLSKLNDVATYFLYLVKSFTIVIIFFLASYGIGRKAMDKFRLKDVPELEMAAFSTGIGLGALSYLFYAMSVLQVVYPAAIWSALALSLVFSCRELYGLYLRIKGKSLKVDFSQGFFRVLPFLLLASILLLSLLYSLANVLSAGWDTFHQYLTFPATYASHHGLVYFPFHPHWGFPQGTEMIYMAGIVTGGIEIAFLLNYFFLISSLFVSGIVFAKVGRGVFKWALFILATIPFILSFLSGYLKVESLFLFYMALALLAFMKVLKTPSSRKYFFLLALFCGLLLSVKYTAFFVIASFAATFLMLGKKIGIGLKEAAYSLIVIFVLFLPWGIKNVVYYHNPLYPAFLGGNDYAAKNLGVQCHNYFIENCQEDLLMYDQDFSFKSDIAMLSNAYIGMKFFLFENEFNIADMGPWVLILLPLVIFYFFKIRDSFIRGVYLFSLVYFLAWLLFLSGQVWYLIPAILGMMVIVTYILENYCILDDRPLLKIMISIWLFYAFFIQLINGNLKFKTEYLRNQVSEEDAFNLIQQSRTRYYTADWYMMWKYVNANVIKKDSSENVYGFMDAQGYFIDDSYKRYFPDFYGYFFRCLSDSGQALDKLKKINMGYIIADTKYIKGCDKKKNISRFRTCESQKLFKDFIANNGEVVHQEGKIVLFRLK